MSCHCVHDSYVRQVFQFHVTSWSRRHDGQLCINLLLGYESLGGCIIICGMIMLYLGIIGVEMLHGNLVLLHKV